MIMRLMADCGARSIPVPEELARAAAFVAAKLTQSTNERLRARGAELIDKMVSHNLALYLAADRLARLNSGDPTERLDHTQESIDLRAACRRDPEILKAMFELREQRGQGRLPPAPGGA